MSGRHARIFALFCPMGGRSAQTLSKHSPCRNFFYRPFILRGAGNLVAGSTDKRAGHRLCGPGHRVAIPPFEPAPSSWCNLARIPLFLIAMPYFHHPNTLFGTPSTTTTFVILSVVISCMRYKKAAGEDLTTKRSCWKKATNKAINLQLEERTKAGGPVPHDCLTVIMNRAGFETAMNRNGTDAKRFPPYLILVDIDS